MWKRVNGVCRQAALAAALIGLAASAGAQELTKIVVGRLPVTGHAKFFVATEQGFFKEEGLDVELVEFTSSPDGLAAFRAEKLDIATFGTSPALAHIASGADVLLIGGVMGEDAFIITLPENADKVKKVGDLKGKKVATVRLATGDMVFRWALKNEGLSWKDDLEIFELKTPPAVIEAVKKGEVDAGVIWGPHDQGAEAKGFKIVIASADLLPGHPCCRILIRTADLNRRGDAWVRLLRALLKAERYSQSTDPVHQERTVKDIVKYLKVDEKLIDNAYYHGRLDQASDPNYDGVKNFWEVMKSIGVINSNDDIANFVETGPYREALDSLIREEPGEPYWKKAKELFDSRNSGAKGGGRNGAAWKKG